MAKKNIALAALVLFACAAFVNCVRLEGKGENEADFKEPGGISHLINVLEQKVLIAAQNYRDPHVHEYLTDMFTRFQTERGKGAPVLDWKGWRGLCSNADGFAMETAQCNGLLAALKNDIGEITVATVEDAVLGKGTEAEKDQVLLAVWQKLTGSPDGDGILEEDMLICKNNEHGQRKEFLRQMKELANVSPPRAAVDFETFKGYYIAIAGGLNPRHFVLMMVNAWHLMGGPPTPSTFGGQVGLWSRVNTVNLRVRVYKNSDSKGGTIVPLWDDCGKRAGDNEKSKYQIIKERLREQMASGIPPDIAFDEIDFTGGI